jgi:uncharacterized membrane protein YdjX (TVP38/TMEM64 family)
MAATDNPSTPENRPERSLARDLVRLLPLCLFFVLMAILLRNDAVRDYLFDIENVRLVLQGANTPLDRLISVGIFVLAGTVLVSVGVPRLWISTLAGAIYGAALGMGLGILASILGSAVVYQVGQKYFGALVQRFVGERVGLWQRRFQENAFWWVLYGRLVPFANATVTSLLCGSCKVPFLPFLAGSLLGFIPLAVVFTIFGSGGVKGNFYQIGLGIVLIAALVLFRRVFKRLRPSKSQK